MMEGSCINFVIFVASILKINYRGIMYFDLETIRLCLVEFIKQLIHHKVVLNGSIKNISFA
jgi:hypothetical protein